MTLCLAADDETQKPDDTPWGKAVDGVACRILVRSNYCVGEKISPLIEFKNVSEEKRSVFNLQSCYCYLSHTSLSTVEFTGPNGSFKQNHRADGSNFGARDFLPIEPGKTQKFVSDQPHYGDVRTMFHWGGPGRPSITESFGPGEYKLTYTYVGAKPTVNANEEMPKGVAGKLVSNTAVFSITAPAKEDLTVHEWGVFSVYTDAKFANEDLAAEWTSLPKMFYRQFPTRRLQWTPAGVRKPIVYFYTKRPSLELEMQVSFAGGAPVVWWPACSEPEDNCDQIIGMYREPAPPPPKNSIKNLPVFKALKWQVGLRTQPEAGAHSKVLVESDLPKDCWLQAARAVKDAALVTTRESERFIYYDGIIPAPDYLRCTESTPSSIRLKNNAAFGLKSLMVVDRRATGKDGMVRFATIEEAAPGTEVNCIFRDVPAKEWPRAGETDFQAALLKAGLTAAESRSVVEIWRAGCLMAKGVTAFYLLPQAEYDRVLPLKITPQPGEILRVGIILHPFIDGEPELRKKAAELIGQLGDEDMDKRDAASKALIEMGGVAFGMLRKAAESGPDPEVRARCSKILVDTDASLYMKKKETQPGYWDREENDKKQ